MAYVSITIILSTILRIAIVGILRLAGYARSDADAE
jgi:hypothetical protein